MFVLVEKIAQSGNYGKVFWEGQLNLGCYVHAQKKLPLKVSNVMLRVWKRDKLIDFIKVSVLLVRHNVTMPPQSRLLREETRSRLNVNSLPAKKTHVIHNWGTTSCRWFMNLLLSTFVRLITESNRYNEKSTGLSGVMLMVMPFGREGSTVAYCRKSVCGVWLRAWYMKAVKAGEALSSAMVWLWVLLL